MSTPTGRIAVTGATGFIGRALSTRFAAEGFQVTALVRDPGRAGGLSAPGISLVPGDLADRDSLRALARDCDTLVHCAGAVRGNSQLAFDHTNVDGLQNLLRVLGAMPRPPRLLLLSSLAAREPELSWYAGSKYRAEQLLAADRGGLDWAIVRPPPVYGPGDREMLPVFRCMASGFAPVPGDPAARVSLIHVTDLVDGILACLRLPRLGRSTHAFADGKSGGYDWHEMSAIAAAVFQRRVRVLRLPALLLDAIAAGNLGVSRVLGYAPMLTPAKLRELRHPDWVVDNAGFTAATGWHPRISLRQGLQEIRDSVL